MDYTWSPGPEPPNNQEVGVPRAIFIPHANSLPFEERRVTLEQPVKVIDSKELPPVQQQILSTFSSLIDCQKQ